ncbi:MAG: hypothetical protein HRT91_02785 [Piscirickettsiaceae bacterium]|nr:hypothetical protein [Piscirickettsiaceae bacterium]
MRRKLRQKETVDHSRKKRPAAEKEADQKKVKGRMATSRKKRPAAEKEAEQKKDKGRKVASRKKRSSDQKFSDNMKRQEWYKNLAPKQKKRMQDKNCERMKTK